MNFRRLLLYRKDSFVRSLPAWMHFVTSQISGWPLVTWPDEWMKNVLFLKKICLYGLSVWIVCGFIIAYIKVWITSKTWSFFLMVKGGWSWHFSMNNQNFWHNTYCIVHVTNSMWQTLIPHMIIFGANGILL